MRRRRRTHNPEFKEKVALAAIQSDLTMAEMVKKFDDHANQIAEWKKQLLDRAVESFDGNSSKGEDANEVDQQPHAKIGQLTMENDFLERGLERIHGPRGKAQRKGPEERNGRPKAIHNSDAPVRAIKPAARNVLPLTRACY
jgi:transposase